MIDYSIPLVDLHRHLDGNIRIETIWQLAQQHGIRLPVTSAAALRSVVQVQGTEANLLAFLSKLDWMVAVLADLDAVKRVAFENVADIAASGLDYAELRFSPYYMAQSHGLPLQGVVEAVLDGIRDGIKQYPVAIKLIGIMSRSYGEACCLQELNALLACADGIVAIDLAGDELGFPGELFTGHFKRVRDAGLQITVHAGEAAGPESIWQAIKELGAKRIGHGVKAVSDPTLMAYLAENRIGIESCPTSNLQTSTVASYAGHPIRAFIESGICVGLNTDDPGVSGIDIQHEYQVASTAIGLSPEQLRQIQLNGIEMAFLSDSERRALYESKKTKAG
ncbi:adenosine deaminase [Shewanella yunxiaonensis]|uniref:Adenosine deaminase n=1 Tax=Shewanella yunxiaonensis TaxID=2829809 RepID=A0ABX7YU59_9GAMM|nr:adenosine deaminase [Shewanella yunxiaonensis]QUN05881.1 adenosine deaminase [Shewanella yunxiaonensis]